MNSFWFEFCTFGFWFALYFLPALLAVVRHNKNMMAIFALNLVAGWTGIGWIVALVLALWKDKTA